MLNETVYHTNLWIQSTACISDHKKKILLIKLGRNGKKTGHSMKTISAAELGMLEQLCSHWNTKFTVMWNGTMLHYSTHFFQAVTQVGFFFFF